EAKEALVKRGDKTALNTLIAEVEALKEADYTTATWAVLIEKLNAAKAVAGEPDASQDAVDAAYDALFEAKEALVKRGDKTALNTLIAEVEALKEADYTTA
ncbi:FIVAR domain-containing protein, partial [Phocea massiliensis]